MKIKVPSRQLSVLYHWGTLDPSNVGKGGPSMEGNCLSASLCPETWLTVARLGAERLYSLKAKSGVFVDVQEIMKNNEWSDSKNALLRHAEDAGYVEMTKVWEVSTYCDDEFIGVINCFDYESALTEADDYEENIQVVDKLVCTPLLLSHLGLHERYKALGTEYGLIAAIKDFCLKGAKVDGIHFANAYDPENHVAPCFGIFPERVGRWSFSPAMDIADDAELMMGLGGIKPFVIDSNPVLDKGFSI